MTAIDLEGKGAPAQENPCEGAASMTANFIASLDRVRKTIEWETEALRRRAPFDYAEVHRAKDQGLLDLVRRMRTIEEIEPTVEIRKALSALRAAIAENVAILATHVAAAKEVSNIVLKAIAEEESDRTYSAFCFNPKRPI